MTMIVGTRLHLGKAKAPPSDTELDQKISGFHQFCIESCQKTATASLIAVDATPKIPDYDFVAAVQASCQRVLSSSSSSSSTTKSISTDTSSFLQVLPVTPWGKFVPALNALVCVAATHPTNPEYIMFVSMETSASQTAVDLLCSHVCGDSSRNTLVAGALLAGHDYLGKQLQQQGREGAVETELNGRTSPWNTLSVWDLKKLSRTGFQLVSDGLLTDDATEPSFGIEEVVAIALLQRLLGPDKALAKLVPLPDVAWDVQFGNDPERLKWHEEKMKSKLERAERQLKLMGLSGKVLHY